ncbi:ABC transporter permease [Falsigemmobacter faecalis]|uniref:ABC transporter permease n=1 Tax=Falsigemmobacter faecalis TaxID=2488730 RepID=A0A3P3D1R3_9RHOB|nr:ABC transporter permease [Falsigemmobacter faecalis]RRH68369.1 ABC transporter permease [Falsigemmobacter faecalis]
MRILKQLLRHKSGLIGSVITLLIVLPIALAPLIYSYDDVINMNLAQVLRPPSLEHPLGTDELGRDLMGRLLWGGRVSLVLSSVSVAIGLVAGVTIGVCAGYFDGPLSWLTMRCVDAMMTFPRMLVALFVITVMGQGEVSLAIAVGISTIPIFARLSRGSTLALRGIAYVEAAGAIGASHSRILLRHILPNILSPLLVQATLAFASAVILAAGLSFLGMGPAPPTPEWGAMTAEARSYLVTAPHIVLAPAVAVLLLVLGFNLLGDALRDIMDPRLTQERH